MRRKKLKYYKSLTDRELLDAVIANDEDAIEYLFFVRCDALFSFVIKRTFSFTVKKEELISDFYLFLQKNDWENLKKFNFLSSLDTWLSTVLVRFFNNIKNRVSNFDEKNALLDENLMELSDGNQEFSRFELLDAINNLENVRHRFVLLSEWKGLKTNEIAESIGVSIDNVYQMSRRARIELKKLIDGRYARKN